MSQRLNKTTLTRSALTLAIGLPLLGIPALAATTATITADPDPACAVLADGKTDPACLPQAQPGGLGSKIKPLAGGSGEDEDEGREHEDEDGDED